MASPSLTTLAPDYAADWARMIFDADRIGAIEDVAGEIAANRRRYDLVAARTTVPWAVVGLLHMREASLDFHTHLHNGDSLLRRTTHVPAGRPKAGAPPFEWADSAVDALIWDGLDRVGLWPLEVIAYRCEAYNGFGPRWRGRKSGYLWAGSSVYDGGKYVADGRWDPTARDRQLGVMPVLKWMVTHGLFEIGARSLESPTTARTPEMLQRLLNLTLNDTAGWEPLIVDGSIGRLTRVAVRRFQGAAGLTIDGIAGPLTWTALEAAAAAK